MKMKFKNIKFQKKGFSLIEVLCAIVLLALVATPVIQIIYSSFSMNIKSKEMLVAADLTSEVMEYVSSLAYENHSYTKTGATSSTIIMGAKNYYFSSYPQAYNSSTGKYSLCPTGTCGTKDATLSSGTVLALKDVDYSGYKFRVSIEFVEDSATAANTYHFYNVYVKVCDNDDPSHVYSQAKTCIPNKY